MKRRFTVSKRLDFEGKGLHSGADSRLIIHPAEPGTGIVFRKDNVLIPAHHRYIIETERRTVLEKDGKRVETVEHVLSALYAMGITDAILEIDGDEVPAMDGSALTFAEAIYENRKELDGEIDTFKLMLPISHEEGRGRVEAEPHDGLRISAALLYEHPFMPSQYFELEITPESYLKEIAPARTFAFQEEVEELRRRGMAAGGTLENALIIGKTGYFNEPRFPDEPVRHKILDLIGDLSLLGKPFEGKIKAVASGHTLHAGFVRKLSQEGAGGPVIDSDRIKQLIPHRYPFLLVDRIIHVDDERAVGIKQITANEEFFQGHFPHYAVMPGVLIVEAIAQVGAIAFFQKFGGEGKMAFFAGIDDVRFRRQVKPGDTMVLHIKLLKKSRRLVKMEGKALVNGEVAASGIFTAIIADMG